MTEKKKKEKVPFYTTRDITEACAMLTLGFFVERVDSQLEGNRIQPVCYFNFFQTPQLSEALTKFRRKEVMVEPQEFMSNLRSLKAYTTNVYKSPKSEFADIRE